MYLRHSPFPVGSFSVECLYGRCVVVSCVYLVNRVCFSEGPGSKAYIRTRSGRGLILILAMLGEVTQNARGRSI